MNDTKSATAGTRSTSSGDKGTTAGSTRTVGDNKLCEGEVKPEKAIADPNPDEDNRRTFVIALAFALFALGTALVVLIKTKTNIPGEAGSNDNVMAATITTELDDTTVPEELAPREREYPSSDDNTPAHLTAASATTNTATSNSSTTSTLIENTTVIATPAATPTAAITTHKPIGHETLFCTFGQATNESTVFPADKLCDFIFFDSAYADGKNRLTDPDAFEPNLKAFFAAVPNYVQTQFGVGFASKYRDALKDDIQGTNQVLADVLWTKGIYHTGVIDVPVFNFAIDDTPSLFDCLKALSAEAEKAKEMGKAAYVVLGIAVYSTAWRKNLQEALRDRFNPDMFIARGHYAFGDHERANCAIMPPTSLVGTWVGRAAYYYTLATTMDDVELMRGNGVKTKWLLSVTMKGRWSKKFSSYAEDIDSVCRQNSEARMFGSYTEVCNNKEYAKKFMYNARYDVTYAKKTDDDLLVFRYDDERSFCQKLCKLKTNHTKLKYGIAVYDLEYEDYHGLCVLQKSFDGPYSRLQALRKIEDFMKAFSSPEQRDDCFKLIPKK